MRPLGDALGWPLLLAAGFELNHPGEARQPGMWWRCSVLSEHDLLPTPTLASPGLLNDSRIALVAVDRATQPPSGSALSLDHFPGQPQDYLWEEYAQNQAQDYKTDKWNDSPHDVAGIHAPLWFADSPQIEQSVGERRRKEGHL